MLNQRARKPVVLLLMLALLVCVFAACTKTDGGENKQPSDEGVITEFTVQFDSRGGTTIPEQKVEKDSTITIPSAPTKEGYAFAGWYLDEETTNIFASETAITGDLMLYSKWTANEYTITFNSNEGSAVPEITQGYSTAVAAPTAPTRTGYTFNGWYTDNYTFENAYTFSTMPLYGIELFADWTINQYTITFNSNEGSAVPEITQDYCAAVVAPAEPTRTGYIFNGWYTDNTTFENAYTFSTMPLNGITLYAKWMLNEYRLNVVAQNSAMGTVNTSGGMHDYNSVQTITATSNLGYTWLGWYDGDTKVSEGESLSYTFNMPAEVKTFTAKWQKAIDFADYTFSSTTTTLTITSYTGSATSISIPNETTAIGLNAFMGCTALTSITIPNNVISIGSSAFSGCTSLETVSFGENSQLTSIGDRAFWGCSGMTTITIPSSLTIVGDYAFKNCSGLISITVESGNTIYHDSGNCLINTASKTLIVGCKNSVIPADGSVTSIGDSAFGGCSGLTSITIPSSVTSIVGSAFSGCSSLESITLPFVGDSAKIATDTNQYPFGYIFGESSYTGGRAVSQAYYGSSTGSTTSSTYYIPSTLRNVTVTGCSHITRGAFYNCSMLRSITISSSVTSIGSRAFSGCTNLESITLPFVGGSAKIATDTTQYPFGYVFDTSGNTGNTVVTQIHYVNGQIQSREYYIPSSLRNVTITGSSHITRGAFYNCSMLTSITIPSSVTSIGEYAFFGCSAAIVWGGTPTITSIGPSAFSGYEGTSISIPASVTSIGRYAFDGCSSLTTITFDDTNSWYYTDSETNWQNKTGGTETFVTSPSTNATYFKETYYTYYWYKL